MISADDAVEQLTKRARTCYNIPCLDCAKIVALIQQQQADCAAMRSAILDACAQIEPCDGCPAEDCQHRQLKTLALSTTAGADLLAHVKRLEQRVQDMRNCDNCDQRDCIWRFGLGVPVDREEKRRECLRNNFKHWKMRGEGG